MEGRRRRCGLFSSTKLPHLRTMSQGFVADCRFIKFIDKYAAEKLFQTTNKFKCTCFERFNDEELCTVS